MEITTWQWLEASDTFVHSIECDGKDVYAVVNNPPMVLKQEPLQTSNYPLKDTKRLQITASTLAKVNGRKKLMMFGSGKNRVNRKLVLLQWSILAGVGMEPEIPVENTNKFFKKVLRNSRGQFTQINIQGATSTGSLLVLANSRKLNSWRDNYLILTSLDFYEQERLLLASPADVRIRKIKAKGHFSAPVCITGLTYVPEKDMLIYIAYNYDDLKKPQSFIGWIANFGEKINSLVLVPDNVANVGSMNAEFKDKLVENLAFKSISGKLITLALTCDEKIYTVVLNTAIL
jgi:hypothetical protein